MEKKIILERLLQWNSENCKRIYTFLFSIYEHIEYWIILSLHRSNMLKLVLWTQGLQYMLSGALLTTVQSANQEGGGFEPLLRLAGCFLSDWMHVRRAAFMKILKETKCKRWMVNWDVDRDLDMSESGDCFFCDITESQKAWQLI